MAIVETPLFDTNAGVLTAGQEAQGLNSVAIAAGDMIFLDCVNVSAGGGGGALARIPTVRDSQGNVYTQDITVYETAIGQIRVTTFYAVAGSAALANALTFYVKEPADSVYGSDMRFMGSKITGAATSLDRTTTSAQQNTANTNTLTLANGPSSAVNGYCRAVIGHRGYGTPVTESVPDGTWTQLHSILTSGGNATQAWSAGKAMAASGTNISQAFTWSAPNCAGAVGVLQFLKAAATAQRAVISLDPAIVGIDGIGGAASLSVLLWPPGGPTTKVARQYDNLVPVKVGGVWKIYLDVTNEGYTNGVSKPTYTLGGTDSLTLTFKGSTWIHGGSDNTCLVENGVGAVWTV